MRFIFRRAPHEKHSFPYFSALALRTSLAFALQPSDYFGEAVPSLPATKTVVLSDSTKYFNVTNGDVVKVVHNDREIVWRFDGIKDNFNLQEILPAEMVNHRITVYVSHDGDYQ
jgi:hypothetical protein